MTFSYSVPARRFYGARVIDDHGLRYEADRSLVDNVGALVRAEWGPSRAARAEQLALAVCAADPSATQPPHARQWAAAVLYYVVGDGSPRTSALIENRTGVSPAELTARHDQLANLLGGHAASA